MKDRERWHPGREHGLVATRCLELTERASRDTHRSTREGEVRKGSTGKPA